MDLATAAKVDYSNNVQNYKNFSTPKKKHAETYTILKSLQDSPTDCAKGLKILDIACGAGEFILEAFHNGAEFVAGLDISESMISTTRSLLAEFPESSYSLTVGNAFEPGLLESTYRDIKFDNITANWLIGYAGNVQILWDFFAGCKKILKSGGRISGICGNYSLVENTEESLGKLNPKIVHYEVLKREEEFATCKISFLNPNTGEKMFDTVHSVHSKQCIRRVLEENGYHVLRLGPLVVSDEIAEHGMTMHDFRGHTEEVGVYYSFLASIS